MMHLATTTPAPPALTEFIPVILLLVTGLLLWTAGRRVLKAGFAAAGLILGGCAGWVLTDVLDLGVSPWLIAAIVGVVCACVAALAYRVPVAAAMGLVCGLGSAMAVVTAGELHDQRRGIEATTAPGAPASDPAADFMRNTAEAFDDASDWLLGRADADLDPATKPAMEPVRPFATAAEAGPNADEGGVLERLGDKNLIRVERARGWIARQMDDARAWWDGIPAARRPTTATAGAIGAIAGLLVGTLVPGVSSTVVTAFGGALLWLRTMQILLLRIDDDALAAVLPDSTTMALVLWVVISLIGVAIQWTFRPGPTDTPR